MKYFRRDTSFAAKIEESERYKRGILGILFKAILCMASEAISAFIRKGKSKALYKALLAMKK